MTTERLTHKRYDDGNEKTVQYRAPQEFEYRVHKLPVHHYRANLEAPLLPIPLDQMRDDLSEDLQPVLDQRIEALQSFVSLEFDPSYLHVATLSKLSKRHGNKYLDEIQPCYAHLTLKEDQVTRGVRTPTGRTNTNCLPLYLTEQHAKCMETWLCSIFTQIVEVTCESYSSQWHDLYVPDIIANLITQAIVDFAKGNVSEPGIQFVLDCLRLGIFCAEATEPNSDENELQFPGIVPLMKKFLLDFIYHPEKRTRDLVPDLGDLFQWLSLLGLLDGETGSWKDDLIHAILVELVRRQARWVGKAMVEAFGLEPKEVRCGYKQVPHRHNKGQMFSVPIHRRETQTEMALRFAKTMSRKQFLSFWWKHGGEVSGRVLLYSHAFYKALAEGHSLESFKSKYDPVLGAAHPGDIQQIQNSREGIESASDMLGVFEAVGHSCDESAMRKLCLWALENREGYVKVDPLRGGWKSGSCAGKRSLTRSKPTTQPARTCSEGNGVQPSSVARRNPFAILETEAAWRNWVWEARQQEESSQSGHEERSAPSVSRPRVVRNGEKSFVVDIN